MLSAPKAVTFTPNDVRSLPRLTGSADVDVAEVLSQFRLVVDFRAKAVAPHDEKFADNLAFERLSLICDGPCLTLYQQLMSGRIGWSANVVNAENINNAGSFAPPSTWEELKLALLDILMPANSVEECAIKSATFQTERRDCIRLRTPFPSAYVPMRIGCRTPCQRTYALGCDNRHPLATQFATRSATVSYTHLTLPTICSV